MAMSKRAGEQQEQFWIATGDMPQAPGHPFYRKLNELLAEHDFDRFVEGLCEKFYHSRLGRPSIPPGVYFRMLLIGYFEGIDSERGIDWRCADSLGLRAFLGYPLDKQTPDHSSLCRVRQRIDVETHREVFVRVLKVLADSNLLKGKTLGVDATTLEANAAMRSIVRRDTGQSYEEFLTGLARASGIETPTREDLARVDKKRKSKASNDDWTNPHDPDAKITKMKDGRTHLANKAEHAVDLDSGAVLAVTVQGADLGDTTTIYQTLESACENLEQVTDDAQAGEQVDDQAPAEVVTDKGYHSNDVLRDLSEVGYRTYASEPKQPRRNWGGKSAEKAAVYGNRRRIQGKRGKALLRKRGELLERPFAHCYESGGMRRTHLRGHENILKRLLIHVAGFNLALAMRKLFGIGKPRSLQDGLAAALLATISAGWLTIRRLAGRLAGPGLAEKSLAPPTRLRPAA